MVVTTILDYFLNNMLISSFSFLKFKILYPYNIYKIIQVFILLSDLHAFISNVIFEGEQSFNPPSTPSRLIFDHSLSSFHHHLGPPHHKSPATTPNNPTTSPSPFQRDVGGLDSLDTGNVEGERRGGTQEVGGPGGASPKRATTLVVVRFLLSLSPTH